MIVIFAIISSLLFNIRTCTGLAHCNRRIYDHIISYDHIRTTALRTCTGLAVGKERTRTAALTSVTSVKVLGDQALDHYHENIL